MTPHRPLIAVGLVAALGGSAALAQVRASTPAGATPGQAETPAVTRSESTTPVMPSGADTRAEVKDDARAASRAGEIPKGDAGVSARHPRGGTVGALRGPDAASSPSRAAVKAEAKAAARAGEIVKGEADLKIKP